MRHVFLVGHGFQSHDSVDPAVEFKVYPSVAVTFYCKDGKMFDSAWEDTVMEKVKAGGIPQASDISRAKSEWEVTTYDEKSAEECPNYIITRPGGIQLVVPYKDSKMIKPDSTGKITSIDDLKNCDTVCVKTVPNTANLPYTTLDRILLHLSFDHVHVKGGTGIHLHWLACRSAFTDLGEIIVQAKSYPALRK